MVLTIGYVGSYGVRPEASLDLNVARIGANQARMPYNNAAGNFNTNSLDEMVSLGKTSQIQSQGKSCSQHGMSFRLHPPCNLFKRSQST